MGPRPRKHRVVESEPMFNVFKPAQVPLSQLEEIILTVEQLEAIRLKDIEGLEQEACAQLMHISRPTFQRVLTRARAAVARALVEGKALRIEGGHYLLRHQMHGRRRQGRGRGLRGCPGLGAYSVNGASPDRQNSGNGAGDEQSPGRHRNKRE